jgi:hypothetical protein
VKLEQALDASGAARNHEGGDLVDVFAASEKELRSLLDMLASAASSKQQMLARSKACSRSPSNCRRWRPTSPASRGRPTCWR